MSDSKPDPRRKSSLYLINRDFQLRYARAAVMVGVSSTLLTATLILYPLYVFEILRIPKFLPIPILIAMIFAAVINISLVAAMTIAATHKVAGPLFALVREFRRVSVGRFDNQLKLRKGDELKFAVRNFNEMLENLREMTRIDLVDIESILARIEKVEEASALLTQVRNRMQQRLGKRKEDQVD